MAEVFKEIAKGSNPITKAAQWAVIKQASAGVTFLNPAKLEAFSNSAGNYEGATNSIKTLVSFPAGFIGRRLFVPWSTGSVVGQSPSTNARGQYTATYNVNNQTMLTAIIRFRQILAPYDLTAVTWNSFIATPPTMNAGMEINFGTGEWAQFPTTKFGTANLPCPIIPISADCYGFVIDLKIVTGTTNLSSSVVRFLDEFNSPGVQIPLFTDGTSAPYVLKI